MDRITFEIEEMTKTRITSKLHLGQIRAIYTTISVELADLLDKFPVEIATMMMTRNGRTRLKRLQEVSNDNDS